MRVKLRYGDLLASTALTLALAFSIVSCGQRDSESEILRNQTLSSSIWSNKPANTYIALDKFFFSSSSSSSFYSCVKNSRISQFIGGYNSGNTGGTYVGTHLANAKAAGLSVSAYFAFNSAASISNSAIDGFLSQIRGKGVKQVWIDIEANVGGASNLRNFYQRVCVSAGYQCGVYTNNYGMGKSGLSAADVKFLNHLPLWFADGSESMNPNRQLSNFYGWSVSNGRQIYLDDNLCGTGVDISIFENDLLNSSGGTASGGGDEDVKIVVDDDKPGTTSGGSCQVGDSVTIGNLSGDPHVNVRSGPGSSYEKLGTLGDGDSSKITAIKDGAAVNDDALGQSSSKWFAVNYNGQTGYFNSLYGNCN